MAKLTAPYYPIIYVRGYAMSETEIRETTSTAFMGFESGSTKIRQAADGTIRKFVFESPLVRLMKDYGYRDTYEAGAEMQAGVPSRAIVIHRYYDPADADFGGGKVPSIVDAANALAKRIADLRDAICGDDKDMRATFMVYLVAHSMGGLICRCFLQNDKVGTPELKKLVDKVFTYATPHNGIEVGGINVPGFLSLNDMSNFNRATMADYLQAADADHVAELDAKKFPTERFFCLVGTNSRDYAVAQGLSAFAVGSMSDGLVKIENAYVSGAPRAYVNRSHSGYFGIVNSEEGYQNLVRFLFGNVRATGTLEIANIPFPPEIARAIKAGKNVDSAYYIDVSVAPRGAYTYDLTRRNQDSECALRRNYSELFKPDGTPVADARSPILFSVFLDTKKILSGSELVFSIDLAISTSGYEIDDGLIFKSHISGEYLFRDTLVLFAKPDDSGHWALRFVWSDTHWASGVKQDAQPAPDVKGSDGAGRFVIPVESDKGFKASLCIDVAAWNS